VDGGGDVNGDGVDDAVAGAPFAESQPGTPEDAGEAYVISPTHLGNTSTPPPTLTLVKTVINDDGGTLSAGDFPVFLNGSPAAWGVAQTLLPGVYLATELSMGYTGNYWGGDCAPDGTVSLAAGENKTCTITNDDVAPTLTLLKTVVNDDGGTLAAADFPAFINGNPTPWGTAQVLAPGMYTVSEGSQPGYSPSAWGGDCAPDGTVALATGESKTCTITNQDVAPTLTLVKTVVNDDGGTLTEADFPVTIDGNAATWGTAVALHTGVHTVAETGAFGYMASSWGGDCAPDGSVTLELGDNKTCSIANDDIAPTVTLVKTVVNDSGGTLLAADFPVFVDGQPAAWGVAQTVSAGHHTASETTPFGYAASPWGGDCAPDGTITLSVGENRTCTLTNDDVGPRLTLIKTVVNDNGGTLAATAFPAFINGNPTVWGAPQALPPGSYTVSETSQPGYAASAWGGDCAPDGSVSLALGESKTCTVINNDIPPRLVVIKHVINDSGRAAAASSFTMAVSGSAPSPASFPGAEAPGTTVILNAGGYSVGESGPGGYLATYSSDCTGTIGIGEVRTCTVTNDDLPLIQTTDLSFCPITLEPFRLIYLQDPASGSGGKINYNNYRLNASNPGQFHLNVLYAAPAGTPADLVIEIPYPYVTNGSTPIQVHDSASLDAGGCLVPSPALPGFAITTDGGQVSQSGAPIVLITDYAVQNTTSTTALRVSGVVPATGNLFVTIHLDYGLKPTLGWSKVGLNDAQHSEFAVGSGTVILHDTPVYEEYRFAFTDGAAVEEERIHSTNVFKSNPGVNGVVLQTGTGTPRAGVRVELRGAANKLVGSATTDADGFFMIVYKHKGKATDFTVLLPEFGVSQTVRLKANGFAVVPFENAP
jgi:hypothetical protein